MITHCLNSKWILDITVNVKMIFRYEYSSRDDFLDHTSYARTTINFKTILDF